MGQNFDHKMTNVVESMNKILRKEHELSVLDLLNEICYFTMAQCFKRYERAINLLRSGPIYMKYCMKRLSNSEQWA